MTSLMTCKKYTKPRILLSLVLCLVALAPSAYGQNQKNLLEYAYASFGDGGIKTPLPVPPVLRVYQDGTVIISKGRKYYTTNLSSQRLNQLKDQLAREPLLQKSRYIEVKNGGMIGLHGGISYIRYLDGDSQVVLAAGAIPKGGEWQRLVITIEKYLPTEKTLFYPQEIALGIQRNPRGCGEADEFKPSAWLYTNKLRLSSSPRTIEISDSLIIKYLFNEFYQGESSGFSWGTCEVGVHYTLTLNKVPGWYRDNEQLAAAYAAVDLQSRHEKQQ